MIACITREIGPLGPVTVAAGPQGLCLVALGDPAAARARLPAGWVESAEPGTAALEQLDEFARGRRRSFDLELDLRGTPFQLRVWELLLAIPYAATRSYGALASDLGRPTAARAVGAAVGANPLCVVVPCHRVIGASGSLTGFAYGLPAKEKLLALEARFAGE